MPGTVGCENSRIASTPLGLRTRFSSAKPASTLDRFRSAKAIVNAIEQRIRERQLQRITLNKAELRRFFFASSSIGRQKSIPTTGAAVFSKISMLKSPVPQPTSSTCASGASLALFFSPPSSPSDVDVRGQQVIQ
jgi:hypothetical protein